MTELTELETEADKLDTLTAKAADCEHELATLRAKVQQWIARYRALCGVTYWPLDGSDLDDLEKVLR